MFWFIFIGLFSGEELVMYDVTQPGVTAQQMCDSLYEQFTDHGFDVLYVLVD